MTWWLRQLDRRCDRCSKRATVVLMNSFNAECGHYCRPCGKREVKRRNREVR